MKIELSKALFENENMDIDKITNTMIHEMTHAYLIEHFNEKGHTSRFHMIMTRITGKNINHRCHNYNVMGLKNKAGVSFSCPCGKADGFRSRMPKAGVVYRAKCCKGIVTFKKLKNNGSMGLFD